MDKKWWQSNTIRLGLATVLGAIAAYLSGQMDAGSAAVLAVTGIIQALQREFSLQRTAGGDACSTGDVRPTETAK
jgi:hypothetical protein